MDIFQLAASVAATTFTASMACQWIELEEVPVAQGLSLLQWIGFTLASLIFVIFYCHLEQFAMATISAFGMLMCARIAWLIRKKTVKQEDLTETQ